MAAYDSEDTSSAPNEDQAGKQAKSDLDTLKKMDEMFRYSLDHPTWVAGRKVMETCHKYVEGDQWTDDELSEMDERKQAPTVDNLCSVTVNKLVGDLVDQRVRIGFRGRNGVPAQPPAAPGQPQAPAPVGDDQIANTLSDIFLYIRQTNDLEFEEREMARDGFTAGFGVIEAYPEFDDLYQPEIKVKAEDSLVVFPDPDSKRYDWNEDAKFISRAKWMDAEEAKQRFPKAAAGIETLVQDASLGKAIAGGQFAEVESFRNDNYVDQKRKRVRMIEVQYKKYQRESIWLFSDGTILNEKQATKQAFAAADKADVAYERIDRIKPKICIGLYIGGTLLDHKVTTRKYFSMVPYWCYRRKNGAPYSLISLALSVQDQVNKRQSKALHLLNSNQTVAERSAIKDKDEYATEIATPDGIAIVEDGAIAQERVIFRNNLDMSQGHMNMHMNAIQMFYSITGINPNIVAQTGEIRSGSGLKTKFAEANKPIAAIFDNLKRTRKILGRVLLDLVQNYYTGEKVFLITDTQQQPSIQRSVTVSGDMMSRIKAAQYDVVIDDFDDTPTVQQEQWALLIQYLPQLIQAGPYWQKKIIATSDLRDKDMILKELTDQSAPPPLQPRLSFQANLDTLSPPERAFMYQLMGNSQLAQQVLQANLPTATETKASVDLAKAKIEANSNRQQGASQGA